MQKPGGAKTEIATISNAVSGANYWTNINAAVDTDTRFYGISVVCTGYVGAYSGTYSNMIEWGMFVQPRVQDSWYLAGIPLRRVHQVLAVMGDQGLSSSRDWRGLSRRFAEERAVQAAHAAGTGWRWVYPLYWPLYLAYRRLRGLLVN